MQLSNSFFFQDRRRKDLAIQSPSVHNNTARKTISWHTKKEEEANNGNWLRRYKKIYQRSATKSPQKKIRLSSPLVCLSIFVAQLIWVPWDLRIWEKKMSILKRKGKCIERKLRAKKKKGFLPFNRGIERENSKRSYKNQSVEYKMC